MYLELSGSTMRKTIYILLALATLTACKDPNELKFSRDAVENVEALWRTIDEKYCYLDEKSCNWDAIREEYTARAQMIGDANNREKQVELFDLMAAMLDSLQDGHVNLYTPFDVSRCKGWYENYPANWDSHLQAQYLGEHYRQAGGMAYTILPEDSIGYIYYGSFSSAVGDSQLAWIVQSFRSCKGIILDVRQNGGGDLEYANKLASIFFREDRTIGYWRHKTGPGHDQLSQREEMKISRNEYVQWQRPVVVLSNRRCYSATNYFLSAMRYADNCAIVGGRSGGGGGMPLSYELPCGWTVRFSSVKMTDLDDQSIEDGVNPHKFCTQHSEDKDDLIEYGIKLIKACYK